MNTKVFSTFSLTDRQNHILSSLYTVNHSIIHSVRQVGGTTVLLNFAIDCASNGMEVLYLTPTNMIAKYIAGTVQTMLPDCAPIDNEFLINDGSLLVHHVYQQGTKYDLVVIDNAEFVPAIMVHNVFDTIDNIVVLVNDLDRNPVFRTIWDDSNWNKQLFGKE